MKKFFTCVGLMRKNYLVSFLEKDTLVFVYVCHYSAVVRRENFRLRRRAPHFLSASKVHLTKKQDTQYFYICRPEPEGRESTISEPVESPKIKSHTNSNVTSAPSVLADFDQEWFDDF